MPPFLLLSAFGVASRKDLNIRVHLAISRPFAGISAPHINGYLTARFARAGIEAQRAALYPKSTVHSVQNRAKGELNHALRGIDIAGHNAGRDRRRFSGDQAGTDAN
jgi:hypothetical protein